MISADTSSIIAFLQGEEEPDAKAVAKALHDGNLVLPPVVVTELLSDPKAGSRLADFVADIPILPLSEGYWERAGRNRSMLLHKGHKARLGDALAAQACIDNDITLIARDRDFRHFVKFAGLRLLG